MNISKTIRAIIILQTDGRRALVKYYDDKLDAKHFERSLASKTKKSKTKDEIIVIDGALVVHRFVTDSHIYVVGNKNENPLVLESVLHCLVDVVNSFSSNSMNNNTVLDNLSRMILALDEICDEGLILETDPELVIQRIILSNEESGESFAQKAARRLLGL